MLTISYSTQFKKDLKKALKRGLDQRKLMKVIEILANEETLPFKYKDHPLADSRSYKNKRECHIEPDWLLIYEIRRELKILYLGRTGSHSDLF